MASCSVLLVDDEPVILDISKRFLERDGDLSVDTCTSGMDALNKLRLQSYDAVVSDYEMHGMDGIDLLKELKAQGYDIPFIIFTGRGREGRCRY